MAWMRVGRDCRRPPTAADLATARFLAAASGGGTFRPRDCAAWARLRRAATAGRREFGIPEGLPAWVERLRSLYLAGLVERGSRGEYRLR